MVEHSRERAEYISRELRDSAVVIQGDALDKEVLVEANVQSAETIIAVTNDDETNIFASVLAKREGCTRAITLVNKTSYEHVLPALGIDAVVSPSAITISTILRHVRHRLDLGPLHAPGGFRRGDRGDGPGGLAAGQGHAAGRRLPDGMLIGAIVRNGEVIIPTSSTRVHPGDSIIAVVAYRALRKAEAILAGPID